MYKNFFFFDIETTSKKPTFLDLKLDDPVGAKIFENKCSKIKEWEDQSIDELYVNKSPIFPEHGKIICMSFGMYGEDGKKHIMTVIDDDEEKLMNKIFKIFNDKIPKKFLCGFNIKNFDIPYIVKKFYKYNIDIPRNLNFNGLKPWEIPVIDLSDIWKGTGKYGITLEEITYDLDIDSPKKIMSGENVHEFYWLKKDIKSIMTYCEGDVDSMIKIAEKLKL